MLVLLADQSLLGSEVESEFSITSEITGFGKAQGIKGTDMGTLRNLAQPSGIGTWTGLGVIMLDGDAVTWTFSYAAKTSAAGAKYICTVTFVTMSEKLVWLNQTICVVEGESGADLTTPGTNVFYEWS
jgi:hypothetical protein